MSENPTNQVGSAALMASQQETGFSALILCRPGPDQQKLSNRPTDPSRQLDGRPLAVAVLDCRNPAALPQRGRAGVDAVACMR
jgi:hypothetical protein